MPTLTVPDLDDATLAILRQRAAKAGRSVEDEARFLLEAAANENRPPDQIRDDVELRVKLAQQKVREMFAGELPKNAVEDFLAQRRAAAERGE